MYAPEIDTLWEADLSFVQDVAEKTDGVSYLFVVVDVFSKYVWVRPMKNETTHCLLEAFGSILSGGRKPEKLRTYEGREFLTSHSISILRRKNIQFYAASHKPFNFGFRTNLLATTDLSIPSK